MKKIRIEIPDGKKAEWVNGVLTLVDDAPQDITERIKTFDDAVKWCDENGRGYLVTEYEHVNRTGFGMSDDVEAYLVLRIIACALNEGWEPAIETTERFTPHYVEKCNNVETVIIKKSCCHDAIKLSFKTHRLAIYAFTQFKDIYADYLGCKKES